MLSYEGRLRDAKASYNKGLHNVETQPEPSGQKFYVGQFVRIAKDLGASMTHFPNDKYARVSYSYAHAYGGNNIDSYSLDIQHNEQTIWTSIAWYYEHQLAEVTKTEELYCKRSYSKHNQGE